MGMKISEMITDRYKLRIPPTVYYELLADVQELEEKQEPKFIAKSDGTIEQIKNCNDCLFKNEWKKIGKLLSVVLEKQTEQEPTTKNDLVTLTFSKGILKYSCKDYVVYKRDWLRSHYGAEIDIMFGDSQYKEPTTKNDLGVDAVSRQAVIELMMQKWGENFSGDDAMQESIDAIRVMPSVTPQEPILDKVRAEIEQARYGLVNDGLDIALNIIDKYKEETEQEDGNDRND